MIKLCSTCKGRLNKNGAFVVLYMYDKELDGKLVKRYVVCAATPEEINAGTGSKCAKKLRADVEASGRYCIDTARI